jgi:hypothetical protein
MMGRFQKTILRCPVNTKKRKPLLKRRKSSTNRPTVLKQSDEPISGNKSLGSSLNSNRQFSPATDQRPALRGEQSGDFEGLETHERKGFESVTELAEEGQDLEAERLDAVEKAPDPDQTELKTRNLPNETRPRKFEDRNRL